MYQATSKQTEITADEVESLFGQPSESHRFANFCNAMLVAEADFPSLPVLSEKPGADGSFDGEWDVRATSAEFSNPFAEPGWNVFQFKARGVTGSGRKKALSDLKLNVKGALNRLRGRLDAQREVRRYVLFTNLQLGLETQSTTSAGATLSSARAELEASIRAGGADQTTVQIVDAAQMAALANKHLALRITYFRSGFAQSWQEKWEEETAAKNYKVSAPFIGREKELEQLSAWLTEPTVNVIAVSGPSGMGKTRLALEATRRDAFRTTVVEVPGELEKIGLQAFGSMGQPLIMIVEDPTETQAVKLAKQAVRSSGIKLLLTFPSEAKTPQLKLTQHEAVKQISLQSLDRERSRKLLESTGVLFDNAAKDWILQQAGGVPEILLSAAELGPALRDSSGDLRNRLSVHYRKRIERELGPGAMGVLRLLSPLHWIAIAGKNSEVHILLTTIGKGTSTGELITHTKSLEQMGFLRHRGEYVSVVPPLFAAALSEELFTNDARAVCDLFDRLQDGSRKRLLERAVTTDLADHAVFWDHLFENQFGTVEEIINNLDLLDYLARAIPTRTARLLETQIAGIAERIGTDEYSSQRSTLIHTSRELAYNPESSLAGVRLLKALAVREAWQKKPSLATQLFCECFVHWYFVFPLSFQSREQFLRRMIASSEMRERRLGARAVVIATHPPHSLSGYTVQARRLGAPPPPRMWQDVYDYLEHLLNIRFELTQDTDSEIAILAQERFVLVFQQRRFLPPDTNVGAIEKFLQWKSAGKLNADEREIRSVIHWIEKRYRETSEKPGQEANAARWCGVLGRLEAIRKSLDEGSFETRLKIALGADFEHDWEEANGKRVYRYQKRCAALAKEALAQPKLITNHAWELLRDQTSCNAHSFLIALGTADALGSLLPRFEAEVTRESGARTYGLYLSGIQEHSPELVNERLDCLAARSEIPKDTLLVPFELTGPTAGNRRRLLRFIAEKTVDPSAVARMFTGGRWLDDLPSLEVRTILEYVGTEHSGGPNSLIHILSGYLHYDKPLPAELIPISARALREVRVLDERVDYHCQQVAVGIAKSDLEKAFEILQTQVVKLNQAETYTRSFDETWNPFSPDGSNDFWMALSHANPQRAYRELFTLKPEKLKGEVGLVLDLERHCDILVNIGRENEEKALAVAELASGSQPGFFHLAYDLMSLYPHSGSLRSTLSDAASYQTTSDFNGGDVSGALNRVEAEMSNEATPKDCLSWLENVRDRLKSTKGQEGFGPPRDYYLGWD